MLTSMAEDGYFLLTVHYVTERFEMHSSQIQCQHLPVVHDHTHISEAISGALSEWCIQLDKDVVAFLTDNGNNSKNLKDALEKLNLPCAGHALNLSVQKYTLL